MSGKVDEVIGENMLMAQEQRGFDYYVREVKKIIFVVLFVLLNEEEQTESMTGEYISVGADYVQILWFPFHQKILYVWKATGFITLIYALLNYLQVQTYLPMISYLNFIISVYFMDFLILLILLDIIYVGYSFSRKRFAAMWPLQILRSVAAFVVTVLFLPITETLLVVIQCATDPVSGNFVLYYFPNVICWQGWHILHATGGCLFTLIFTIICAVVAYAFFEPRMCSGNKKAREDTRGELVFILDKVTCQVLFSVLGSPQVWTLVITTFTLSLALFLQYNYYDPFYDKQVGLFYQIMTSYYLWTNTILLISTILYNTSFDGGLVAYVIGLPFIISIMMIQKKSRIDTLVRSQTKFRSGEQIQAHLRYVLQLIQNQVTDKNAYMLLIGYIEKHKETCNEEDCPLKAKKQNRRRTNETEIDEQIRSLLLELNRIFVSGLKKFPQSTKLRLAYAFFLLERFKNKNKAYEQLLIAEKGKTAFDQEFIIYRYKKIINENLDDENEQNADIVSIIAFDNHISLCEEYMKFSANLHKEFWAELKEDEPDLGKLNMLGSNISKTVMEAKGQYQKMQKINPSFPQTIKVFATYCINVLNDKIRGAELLKEAKVVKDSFREEISDKKEDLELSPIPFIYVSAKKLEQGQIMNLNSLFTTYFGYQKEELIGKQLQVLMPQIYHGVHEKYIQSFIENILTNLRVEGEIESEYLDQDQMNYFKHKNGYIFPMSYKVSLNLDSLMFVTTFKGEATIKSFVYFIVNVNWEIQEMSTGAITYFDLEIKNISSKFVRLDTIIPDVIGNVKGDVMYTNRANDTQDEVYYFKKEINEIKFSKAGKGSDSEGEDQKDMEDSGYKLVKLERIEQSEAIIRKQSFISKKNKNTNSGSLGQDSLSNIPKINFVGQPNVGGQLMQLPSHKKISTRDITTPLQEIDQSYVGFMQDLYANPKFDDYKQLFKMQVEEESLDRVDFGVGILTRRLIDYQIISINEEQEEDFLKLLEEEEQENSIFGNMGDGFEDEDDYRIFTHSNSDGIIKKALSTKIEHQSILKFKVHSSLWIVFVLIVTILQYYFCITSFNSHNQDISAIKIINQKLVDLNQIISRVLDFTIVTQGLYGPNFNDSTLRSDVNSSALSILQLNEYFNSAQYYDFYVEFNQNVNFRFFQQDLNYTDTVISLEASLLLLTSYSLNLSVSDNSSFYMNNSYVQGVIFNFFNRLNGQMVNISQDIFTVQYIYVFQNVTIRMNSPEVELLCLLAVLILVTSVSMFNFIVLMLNIKMERENILFLFLDIQQDHVEKLYRNTEKFLKNYVSMRDLMNSNQTDGYESSDDELEGDEQIKIEHDQDEEDNLLKQQQARKKIIKKFRQNKFKGNKSIILQFVIIALFTLVFAVFNIISTITVRSNTAFLLPQYYQNSFLVSVYGNYLNVQKIMMIDNNFTILNENVRNVSISGLQNFTGNSMNLRSFNYALLGQMPAFRVIYMNLYYGNACQILLDQITPTQFNQCETIIDSNMQMGLVDVEQYYLEFFRINLQSFLQDEQAFSQLLSNPMLRQIDTSLYFYFDDSVSELTLYEQNMIKTNISSTQNIQLILLIFFVLILVVFFLAFWIPYLNSLNTQINQTIEMLNMIPINVIKENKSIRRFVKNLIKTMDSHQE